MATKIPIGLGNLGAKVPARIERWGLRLTAFKFRVVHVKGYDSIIKRLSIPAPDTVIYHATATPKTVSLDSIKAQTTRAKCTALRYRPETGLATSG